MSSTVLLSMGTPDDHPRVPGPRPAGRAAGFRPAPGRFQTIAPSGRPAAGATQGTRPARHASGTAQVAGEAARGDPGRRGHAGHRARGAGRGQRGCDRLARTAGPVASRSRRLGGGEEGPPGGSEPTSQDAPQGSLASGRGPLGIGQHRYRGQVQRSGSAPAQGGRSAHPAGRGAVCARKLQRGDGTRAGR